MALQYRMTSYKSPYLSIVGMPRQMGGKGAPYEMIPGILGHTTMSSENKVLGGLVTKSSGGSVPDHIPRKDAYHTDHMIAEKKSASHVPKIHYGQVLYPGTYAYKAGAKL